MTRPIEAAKCERKFAWRYAFKVSLALPTLLKDRQVLSEPEPGTLVHLCINLTGELVPLDSNKKEQVTRYVVRFRSFDFHVVPTIGSDFHRS